MSLPNALSGIFTHKQKSYKMVLVLALLSEMDAAGERMVFLQSLKTRFQAFLQDRESSGEPVDPPVNGKASWSDVTLSQITQVIQTPITVLQEILEQDPQEQTIGFKKQLYETWDQDVLIELHDYAMQELEQYYSNRPSSSTFSLRDTLHHIMKNYLQAKMEPFGKNAFGDFVRRQVPAGIKSLPFIHENLKIQASVGQGVWATIPWIAILDRRIGESTQRGEYIVYLFAEDMQSVYLTLAQGVTEANKNGRVEGHKYLRRKAQELRAMLPLEGLNKDEEIHLTSGGLGRDYQVSTVAYYKYDRDQLPDEGQLISDLHNLVNNYEQYVDAVLNPNEQEQPPVADLTVSERLAAINAYIRRKGFTYPEHLIENFYLSLKSKPFVILAGVSGTGKTKLIKLFAEALGATSENKQFTLIPVRPDWSDPSDLLGYKDLSHQFRPGPLTEVLTEASRPANRHKPYFICLDEMNLARVEHYFSDMLSILETQQWRETQIVTDLLIREAGLVSQEDKMRYGNLYLPENVYLIGTVNMDETTHPFSKKVLDRANTLEFNYIRLDQLPELRDASSTRTTTPPVPAPNAFLRADYLQLIEVYDAESPFKGLIEETTAKLVEVNNILESIHSHVGFRIRDAVCFYLIYNEQSNLLPKDAAFDLQLLQKILPRVQGSHDSIRRVLLRLLEITLGRKLPINEWIEDASELWKDVDKTVESAKYKQSARKIIFMLRRLDEDGFTSYWLS
ncbi:MrcB family domain-containing protein [Cohnella soli]|uniref:MrcB family domain-containing protein n=1 Tax=Cohnella soli TaxID=425005 RepID=A0ABW0HXS6_9BACL